MMGSRRDPWFIEASPFNPKSYGAYPEYEFHFDRGRERNQDLKFQAPNLSLPQGLDRLAPGGPRQPARAARRAAARVWNRARRCESFDRHRQAAISLLTDPQRAAGVRRPQCRPGRARPLRPQRVRLVAADGPAAGRGGRQPGAGEPRQQRDVGHAREQLPAPARTACCRRPTAASRRCWTISSERGLLDETLIVMCGEFGRTPKINAAAAVLQAARPRPLGRGADGLLRRRRRQGRRRRRAPRTRTARYPAADPQTPGEPGRHDLPRAGHPGHRRLERRTRIARTTSITASRSDSPENSTRILCRTILQSRRTNTTLIGTPRINRQIGNVTKVEQPGRDPTATSSARLPGAFCRPRRDTSTT